MVPPQNFSLPMLSLLQAASRCISFHPSPSFSLGCVATGEYTSAQVSCTPPGARPRQLSRNREERSRVGAVVHFGGVCLLCLHPAANSALLWRWMKLCCDAAVIPAYRHSPDRIPGTMIFLVDCVCALGKTTGARDSLAPPSPKNLDTLRPPAFLRQCARREAFHAWCTL